MKKVVIIGGGFAGARAAKNLENKYQVTLLDTKDYFEFTPGILRTIIETPHMEKVQIHHEEYLSKATFMKDCAKEITKKQVLTKNGKKLAYDYLIIASGSHYALPFKEEEVLKATRAEDLKKYHLELEKANKITIIGGGIVGVELAAEIAPYYEKRKKVTLIHSRDKLASRNTIKCSNYVQKFLEKHGVKIVLGERANKIEKKQVITSKGTKIAHDMIFLCTGIKANSQFITDKNMLNERKQVKVNEFLQVPGYNNIFAAGDVNEVNEEKTAQASEKQAMAVVHNINNLENNKPLIPYKSEKKPMVISLGKHDGVLEYKNFTLTGAIPAFLKRFVEWKTMIRYKR